MAVTPIVYDWPRSIVPAFAMFRTGGQGVEGGYTTGGVLSVFPEAGGRASVEASFSYFNNTNARIVSWLTSKVMNGTVFRFPLSRCPQLVSLSDLSYTTEQEDEGTPWSNEQPWDTEENWLFDPMVPATEAALKGAVSITIDLSEFGSVVQYGHVIGHRSRAYMIEDIDYQDDGTAVLMISPPLRRPVAQGDPITFLPSMLCAVEDPNSFRSMFDAGGLIQPGSVTLREVLL